jgi:histidyl-tRNA synthetase
VHYIICPGKGGGSLYKSPRGTSDILPEEQKYWRYIEANAARLCQLYGYERIETPVFEDSQLFIRSIGEGTDIVTKEMYIFKDQSDNSLALRPEGTAPICRAYVEHGMDNKSQPVKLYYLATIFRYERPQAGRYRQHHQFGCEAIGEVSPVIDAEVIELAWQLFISLGLTGLSLQLNSIGCPVCRPKYLEKLVAYYVEQEKNICRDCQVRYAHNPLRLLDCKNESCQGIADRAPRSSDFLCPDCEAHFIKLRGYMDSSGLVYNINHRLVRGLDYYTRTVFEIQPPDEGSQSTICGGGRYDNLIEEIGGKPTPALGFACGMERIIANLKKQNVEIPEPSQVRIFIASLGEEAILEAVKLSAELRRHNIAVVQSVGNKSLKAQLRQADNYSVSHVIIIGEDELKAHKVTLRNMKTSQQQTVGHDDLIGLLQ